MWEMRLQLISQAPQKKGVITHKIMKLAISFRGYLKEVMGFPITYCYESETMKYIFFLFIFTNFCGITLANDDGSTAGMDNGELSKIATLIVYRPKGSPPLLYKPMLVLNNWPALSLPHGHHAIFQLVPGTYSVVADWKALRGPSDSKVEVTLVSGKETYVKLDTTVSLPVSGHISGGLMETSNTYLSSSKLLKSRARGWYSENPYTAGGPLFDYKIIIKDLQSDDYEVKRAAARLVANNGIYIKSVLDVLEQEVLENYKKELDSRLEFDSIAWLCRALAQSGKISYKPTLSVVSEEATNKKLKKYARKYIDRFLEEDE